ncbi:hypothetical protein [Streptomyces sp. NPDC006463]|uniref:hypothetical protein n=1 Tax=Streptomyces sp. NPDC006463 TaxID=3364746 RepID=UPI00368B8B88
MVLAEPYELWRPLAARLLGGNAEREPSQSSYVNCTWLMRTSAFDLWVRLRALLDERGLRAADTVLVYLWPSGSHTESGVVLSDGGRVYEFDLGYNRMRAGSERRAVIEHWQDITDRWQANAFSSEIADAFIWRPPRRRTSLAVMKVDDVSSTPCATIHGRLVTPSRTAESSHQSRPTRISTCS